MPLPVVFTSSQHGSQKQSWQVPKICSFFIVQKRELSCNLTCFILDQRHLDICVLGKNAFLSSVQVSETLVTFVLSAELNRQRVWPKYWYLLICKDTAGHYFILITDLRWIACAERKLLDVYFLVDALHTEQACLISLTNILLKKCFVVLWHQTQTKKCTTECSAGRQGEDSVGLKQQQTLTFLHSY